MNRLAPDVVAADFADQRVATIDPHARYAAETSADGGRTWTPDGLPTVCGGHVRVEVARALSLGEPVTTSGTARTLVDGDGTLVRWTPVGGGGRG